MNEKIRQILVPLATMGVIFVNYLAAAGRINNITPEVVSNKYPTILTPAGYAFSIWGLIYLGMIGFSIYQALPANTENPRFRRIRTIYILNCAANCAWIYFWHYEMIIASLIVIILLLGTLFLISFKLRSVETITELWLAKVPFNIYFGWVTIATILNSLIALKYLGVETSMLTDRILGASLIFIATIFAIIMRFKLNLIAFPLAIAWALTAIAVAHGGETLIVTSSAIAVIILLVSALSALFTARQKTR